MKKQSTRSRISNCRLFRGHYFSSWPLEITKLNTHKCLANRLRTKNTTHTYSQSEWIREHHSVYDGDRNIFVKKNLHYCFIPPFQNWILYTYTTITTTTIIKIQPIQLLQTAGVLSDGQYIVLATSVTANNNVEIHTYTHSHTYDCMCNSFELFFHIHLNVYSSSARSSHAFSFINHVCCSDHYTYMYTRV